LFSFFAGFAWALWTVQNKMAIEKTFIKAPTDVVYVAISLLQRWSTLLKEKEDAIMGWLKTFKPRSTMATDVVEI
jgi:hypothetical protein